MQHTQLYNLKFNAEMLSPLKDTLLDIYPVKDGWKLFNRYNWASKVFDFILEKKEGTEIFRVLVEFNFESFITTNHLENLSTLAARLNNGLNTSIVKKIMIVCDGNSILSNTTAGIEFIPVSQIFSGDLLQLNRIKPKLVA